jgi:hypothetical protein
MYLFFKDHMHKAFYMAIERWQKNLNNSLARETHHTYQQNIDNSHISFKTLNPKCNTD